MADRIELQLGPFAPEQLHALVDVPRERFVRAVDVEHACDDTPLPLDDFGLATISAPHAYLLSFRLLELRQGDRVVELGSGSGYGAALASAIVGTEGDVLTLEIDPHLARRAETLLAPLGNVHALRADAMQSMRLWGAAKKIVCTFAVDELPPQWLKAIPAGGVLVAPVGGRDEDQRLVRVTYARGELRVSDHGAVRYVKNRSIAHLN
jgi:protein-L-isoaspartate(D-aspartate) O-methyltransferase